MSKINSKILLLILAAFIFSACSQNKKTEEQYLTSAKTIVDSAQAKNDQNLFKEGIKVYEEFLKEYPNSGNAVAAYFAIANIYNDNLKSYPDAIKNYKMIAEKYPDKKEAKNSLFLVAFIYDNYLQDKENAKTSYKNFLAKYPTDTDPQDNLSGSAKAMLDALESGKSIEDIIMKNIENQPENKEANKEGEKKDEKKTDKKEDMKMDTKKTEKTKMAPENTDAPKLEKK
jgi:tetratricopeptide (TPR) repeat protein